MDATDQASPLLDENGKFAKGNKPPTGFHTNPERINPGGWRKVDTPRYKLEQMMKLSSEELNTIARDKKAPLFEQKMALAIYKGEWREIKEMIEQVYGRPKESVDVTTNGESINAKSLTDEELLKIVNDVNNHKD